PPPSTATVKAGASPSPCCDTSSTSESRPPNGDYRTDTHHLQGVMIEGAAVGRSFAFHGAYYRSHDTTYGKVSTWTHIAEVCGVHVGTVLKWARRAQADDLDAVIKGGQRGRRHGSGRTLTLVQEAQLRLKIIGSNPAQLQLEFALWNRRAVMLAIKQLFGIDMPIRTVGEYLRRWGFTPQRPVKRALEQDPARLKAWLEDEYPKIVARAKTEDAEIYWVTGH
ncbi:winged helix-turn-helix domain-containing protein, partial [Thauera aromatica]